jgi:hypothetical protein
VDRSVRNPNLLCWHKSLYFIDHGAALYFHHDWQPVEKASMNRFAPIRQHVLLPWAAHIAEADEALRPLLTQQRLAQIVELVPDEWLLPAPGVEIPEVKRAAYVDYFLRRRDAASIFVEEATRARAELV